MKTIKKVSSKSVARLFGLMYALMGFIFGIVTSAVSLIASSSEDGFVGLMFGVGAIIALPILYGVMGWIMGYIMGWLYNFTAKRVGGIQIEIE